ncbi:MAG: hypothetical protein RBS16_00210 [Candidatus Cloacimonadales bacterium]|nr:hypothetical protein [Candidatus Cloacimonadota bacterium]MDD3501079.1 hypothetical protein [Candidatus Cloacimonadota bacterium]MDX9976438.1 hypothetical protein [Candidatus Cloacimonadales bacterium]
MRRYLVIIALILLISSLFAQKMPYELNVFGNSFYNSIRAAAIDVDNPNNQPIIFTARIKNDSNNDVNSAYMSFTLKWNGNLIINNSMSAFKEYGLNMLNNSKFLMFTNRDIISEAGSIYLTSANPSISLSDFLNNRHFKSAIMNTGLFPDGTYEFIMQVKSGESPSSPPLSNQASFTMLINNVSNIVLLSPGAKAGQQIPSISQKPIIYSWSANISNPANPYMFEIREYAQESSMNLDNLGHSGRRFHFEDNLNSPLFNENLDYVENNYYAWRISVPLITDQTEFGANPQRSSQWNIFKYVSSSVSIPNPYESVANTLETLQNPQITQLLNQHYLPNGVFKLDNVNISASQAQNLISEILNAQNVLIEIID